jgi:tetratricopeptide (TPR) repeat protein
MVVPALAVVIHIAILRGSWRAALKWTAAWWPITLGAMIVARLAQQVDVPFAPLWLRPLVAGDALAFYAGKILWPWKLCIDYGRSPAVAQDGGWIYATWLIPVAIAALLWRKPRREIIAAALLATICVAPVLGLASFMFQFYSTVADHYLYLAMLGPALAVAWIVANDQKYARPVAFVVIGLFAVKSFAQTATWRDDESLFTHTLAVNEKSFVACNNLGGSFDSMGDALVAGAKIADDMGDPVTGRAYRRLAVENFQRARELYVKSIETRQAVNRGIDDHLQTRGLLAMTCSKLKRHDEALAHWAAAAEMINSRLPHLAKTELPKIHCLAAKDLLALRRPADAMRHLAAARALDPNNLAIADTTDQAQRMLATTPLD